MKNRLLLLIALTVSGLAFAASAASRPGVIAKGETGPLTWSLTRDGTLTIRGEGAMPDYLSYIGQYRSSSPWDKHRAHIEKIVVSEGVTSVGRWAFGCGETQMIAGNYAGVTEISLPKSLMSIGLGAFKGCSTVSDISIPDAVTSIGWRAFYECAGLTEISIPASVQIIEEEAFVDCPNLREINVADGNQYFCSEDGVLFDRGKMTLIVYPGARNGDYSVPAGVKSIDKGAFQGVKGLTGITLPDGLTTIDERAFNRCIGLREITIPNSVTTIGSMAFMACTALKSVTMGSFPMEDRTDIFWGCKALTSVRILDDATDI